MLPFGASTSATFAGKAADPRGRKRLESACGIVIKRRDVTVDPPPSRFNGLVYERSSYAPRMEEIVATEELRFTRDVTPAGRVKDVFDRFSLNEAKRGKRYLNTTTVIR